MSDDRRISPQSVLRFASLGSGKRAHDYDIEDDDEDRFIDPKLLSQLSVARSKVVKSSGKLARAGSAVRGKTRSFFEKNETTLTYAALLGGAWLLYQHHQKTRGA
jgi:hypothetical protein